MPPGVSGGRRIRFVRAILALGLAGSGVLIVTSGGWPATTLGAGQLLGSVLVLALPDRPGVVAATAVVLVLAPISAARHWTAHLPLTCACQRMAEPAPGLLSRAGLTVLTDLGLIGLAVWLVRTTVSRTAAAEVAPE